MAEIPRHIIRYGSHPEKEFFREPFDKLYDGVLLNANTVAYSTRGIAEFLTQNLNKPFCIDPLVHAFGHNPIHISKNKSEDNPEVRSAFKKLAEYYGEPVVSVLGERGLDPEDFVDKKIIDGFCKRVIDFQKNSISNQITENEEDKYISRKQQTPCIVMAPYFYMSSTTFNFWIELNRTFIDRSVEIEKELPVFGYILISEDAFFDDEVRQQLTESYKNTKASGIMLWIESFSEHAATEAELKKYKSFVSEMSQNDKKIITLYGGYFSITLQKYGLYGVTHGPGYGESREVTPVGGGLPKPKFYFPSLYERLSFREVMFAIRQIAKFTTAEQYYENVCDCTCCKKIIGKDISNFSKYGESKSGVRKDGIAFEYQTTQARILNTAHYLFRKDKEFKDVERKSIQEIREELEGDVKRYKKYFGIEGVGHLYNWSKALVETK